MLGRTAEAECVIAEELASPAVRAKIDYLR